MKRNSILPGLLLVAGSRGMALVGIVLIGLVLIGLVWASPVFTTPLSADSTSASLATTTLSQDVAPIITQRCVMCHIAGAAQGGLDLYTNLWSAVVNVKSTQSALKLVEPGDPEKSYLFLKLTSAYLTVGGSGGPMPLPPGQLDAGQMELIRAWIAQGAPNN